MNEAAGDIARALVDDVIQNVIDNTNVQSNRDEDDEREQSNDVVEPTTDRDPSTYLLGKLETAKSTPVTISDYLGLDPSNECAANVQIIEQHSSPHMHPPQQIVVVSDEKESLSADHLHALTDLAPQLKKVESFEINGDESLSDNNNNNSDINDNSNNNNNGSVPNLYNDEEENHGDSDPHGFGVKDNGRLIGLTRADKLMQVHTLFNKIYTQVMIINDPPYFYKQAMQCQSDGNDVDEIDFISTDEYASKFANPQSEPYNNIATYLKSMLPASLIGNSSNATNQSDELDDEYNDD